MTGADAAIDLAVLIVTEQKGLAPWRAPSFEKSSCALRSPAFERLERSGCVALCGHGPGDELFGADRADRCQSTFGVEDELERSSVAAGLSLVLKRVN